jgi:hypothetical protein
MSGKNYTTHIEFLQQAVAKNVNWRIGSEP